jgi:hypothetical protein
MEDKTRHVEVLREFIVLLRNSHRTWKPIGLRDIEDPTFSGQSAHSQR